MYHILITAYGWTIDYINEYVTIPQIIFLLEEIGQHPPLSVALFDTGKKSGEAKLMKQLDSLGDKVVTSKWYDNPKIKSVVRLKDKKKIK